MLESEHSRFCKHARCAAHASPAARGRGRDAPARPLGRGVGGEGEQGDAESIPFFMNFSSVVSCVTWLSISPMAFLSWLHSHGMPAETQPPALEATGGWLRKAAPPPTQKASSASRPHGPSRPDADSGLHPEDKEKQPRDINGTAPGLTRFETELWVGKGEDGGDGAGG